jgi:hypothetical protein
MVIENGWGEKKYDISVEKFHGERLLEGPKSKTRIILKCTYCSRIY